MSTKFGRLLLTESAHRHGYELRHVHEVLQNRPLVLRSRRGVENGYDVLGQTFGGDYLEIVGRVIERERIETSAYFISLACAIATDADTSDGEGGENEQKAKTATRNQGRVGVHQGGRVSLG